MFDFLRKIYYKVYKHRTKKGDKMTAINEKDFEKIETGDLNYYLIENIKEMIREESEIRDNTLFIPEYSLSIRPQITKSDSNMAVINYYLYSENWDREIFECSASMGENRKQALSLAEQGFIFGIMSGIKYMMKDEFFKEIKTEFNGSHSWKMYSSDIVAMGDVPETVNPSEIWKIIENEIPKYLGNQKMSYIKVFAAKNKDDITGECRINDEPIKELSELIVQYISKWNTENFGLKKQFFFAVQDDKTYTPYPYTEEQIEKFVLETADMFEKVETEKDLDDMLQNFGEKIGDYDLAEELMGFIPEICAERAFPNINYPEKVIIYMGEDEKTEVNKSQIASYHMIKKAVNHMIDHGHIMKELYHKFISISSAYNVICQALEKDKVDLTKEEGAVISTAYGFSENYRIR